MVRQLLLPLLISASAVGAVDYRHESMYHALQPPFLDKSSHSMLHYDYLGDTLVRSDKYIRLTPDLPDRRGILASKLPALPESFQVEIDFAIESAASGYLHGDGMGIFFTENRGAEGSVMGMTENFNGIAILIDTYKNMRQSKVFPYIMVMRGDGGKTPYDADHDGKANEIMGCSARNLVNNKYDSRLRITFVKDRFFAVDIDYKGHNEWTKCFATTDITEMPAPAYLSLTAQTGELSETHDIHSIHVYQLDPSPGSYEQLLDMDKGKAWTPTGNNRGANGKVKTASSGWAWFMVKFVLFLGLMLGLYVSFTIYRANHKSKKSQLLL